jgi:LysR family transcriptional regulator of gallate degradation
VNPSPALLPLRLLRAAAVVAQEGSASRAARTLHLSVSAVTRAVQAAEALLGVALFERGARGMVPTAAGAVLVQRVHRALAQLVQGAGPTLAQQATEGMLAAMPALDAGRSESAAAQLLGITQPAVHEALRRLEHAARLRLFDRSRTGTRLTSAGERLLRHVGLAQAELRSAEDELAAFRGAAIGRLSVGALPMASEVLVPQALSQLFETDPGVRVTVVDGTYEALLHQLLHGAVDLIVGPLRGERCDPAVAEEVLFVDRLLPVVRRGHPLLAGPPPRTLRPLLRWPWIGPLPGTPARAAFERAFQAAGLAPPAVGLQANSPSVVRAVLLGGDHVALLSTLQIRAELASGALQVLAVPVRRTERVIGFTQRCDGLASPACRRLLAALRVVAAASRPPSQAP